MRLYQPHLVDPAKPQFVHERAVAEPKRAVEELLQTGADRREGASERVRL